MATAKTKLMEIGRFHLADPSTLEGLEEWALWLEAILHNDCAILERSGESFLIETKRLVARLDGLRIQIYPNEHAPPHFHVEAPGLNASFAIDDCRVLEGQPDSDIVQRIRFWHRHAKGELISVWNSTRPTDCVVGKYRDA